MEEKVHGRRRAGGRHSDPIGFGMVKDAGKKPRGAHAAHKFEVVIPPKPERKPSVGLDTVAIEVLDTAEIEAIVPHIPAAADALARRRARTRYQSMAAAATGGMLLITGAQATTQSHGVGIITESRQSQQPVSATEVVVPEPITVPTDTVVPVPKVEVTTIAAPLPEPEPVVVETVEPEPVVVPAPAVVAPAPAPRVVEKPAQVTLPSQAAPVASVAVGSGKGQAIAAAALGQIGWSQDCTALASNSLQAAGINYPRHWPWEYATLGTNVGVANAQPGDLLLYAAQNGNPAHIAVYIGNGQAVHGGWDGWTTKVWSTFVGQPAFGPYAAIRV